MKKFMSILLVTLFTIGISLGCTNKTPKDDSGAVVQEPTTETTTAPVDTNAVK